MANGGSWSSMGCSVRMSSPRGYAGLSGVRITGIYPFHRRSLDCALDPRGSHVLEANSDCDGATEPHGSTHAQQNEDKRQGEHARRRGDHHGAAHEAGTDVELDREDGHFTAVGILESITASFVKSSSRFNR